MEVKLSKEIQQEFSKAFKNAKFEKTTSSVNDYDYVVTLTLISGHTMFIDSNKKTISLVTGTEDRDGSYTIANGSDFFDILEKATK